MRRFPIGARLAGAFAAVLILLLGVAAMAFATIVEQRTSANHVRQLEVLTPQAEEIKTHAATLNGWQAATSKTSTGSAPLARWAGTPSRKGPGSRSAPPSGRSSAEYPWTS